jgi:energy-converting hydrogenase Eha subunit C
MSDIPLLIPGLIILLAGALAWREPSARVWARILLGSGTVLVLAAARYPGMGAEAVLENSGDGLVYLVAVARVTGVAALLFCGAAMVRARLTP